MLSAPAASGVAILTRPQPGESEVATGGTNAADKQQTPLAEGARLI